MLSPFITYIQNQELFRLSRDKILLAVSGGMDSIALVHLCQKAGVKFGIAHCNFQLRGEESDGDAAFVEALAKTLDVPFHSTSFDTNKVVRESKKSVQMAARDLRYNWFEEVRNNNDYDYIATAHHHNDVIETMLTNLTMGCGIRGLHGIYAKKERLIRPLLFSTRTDIEAYIQEKNIAYREDSSNTSTKYSRNALRHLVIPELKKINPNLEATFDQNIQRFRETEALYGYAIQQLKSQITEQKNQIFYIDIEGLSQSPAPRTLLYELLTPFHFKPAKIEFIYKNRNEDSGVLYTSKTHQLLRDRTHWMVQAIVEEKTEKIVLSDFNTTNTCLLEDQSLTWEQISTLPTQKNDHKSAYIDLDKVEFPLHLRHWKDGDAFYPFGMGGRQKKLSKFFKDIKMNRFEKDATWLLCNANDEIIWVVGHRADDRFKVDPNSKNLMAFVLRNTNEFL